MDGGLVAGLAGALGGGALTYLGQRLINSGGVKHATATDLFGTATAMIEAAEGRAQRAEDRLDKLIDSQGSKVAPALAEISTSLQHLAATDTQIVVMVREALQLRGQADAAEATD